MLVHGYQEGRGEFAQTALMEVLKTASLDIMPGRCFQAPLVGKTVEEAKALLDGSDIKAEMQRALADFQTWISRSRA
jgi:NAD(P)H-dependent FMN reductase